MDAPCRSVLSKFAADLAHQQPVRTDVARDCAQQLRASSFLAGEITRSHRIAFVALVLTSASVQTSAKPGRSRPGCPRSRRSVPQVDPGSGATRQSRVVPGSYPGPRQLLLCGLGLASPLCWGDCRSRRIIRVLCRDEPGDGLSAREPSSADDDGCQLRPPDSSLNPTCHRGWRYP